MPTRSTDTPPAVPQSATAQTASTAPPHAAPTLATHPERPTFALAGTGISAVTVIAILMVFFALYFAASLFIPIACAFVLSTVLGPAVERLERLWCPRPLAAVLIVLGAAALLAFAILQLGEPAQKWVDRAPEGLRRVEQRLEPIRRRLETLGEARGKLADAGLGNPANEPQRVIVVRPAINDVVLGAPHIIAPILSVIVLTMLLLVAGDVFQRKLVAMIPTFKEKKRTVEIIRTIEGDISYYLMTFIGMNVGLGVIMGFVTWFLGIPNPLLWGGLVALLNCVPYIGLAVSMATLGLAGITTVDSMSFALAAPLTLLALAVLQAQVVTPLVVSRGLRLNPVAIFVSVMLWGWLWGIVGILLAVPLLASFKIICERVESLSHVAEFLTEYAPRQEED